MAPCRSQRCVLAQITASIVPVTTGTGRFSDTRGKLGFQQHNVGEMEHNTFFCNVLVL